MYASDSPLFPVSLMCFAQLYPSFSELQSGGGTAERMEVGFAFRHYPLKPRSQKVSLIADYLSRLYEHLLQNITHFPQGVQS